MPILYSLLYLAALGILSHFAGNAMPRRWFDPEKSPWRSFSWEKNGKIYRKLKIHKWKDKLPDASKCCNDMVRKEVSQQPTAEELDLLARETCVAELIHFLLMFCSIPVVFICPNAWGWVIFAVYSLSNLPFMMIQRYNRPRLVKMSRHLSRTVQDKA